MDQRVTEPITESVCQYWLSNKDSSNPLLLWDALKVWVKREYISCIVKAKKDPMAFLAIGGGTAEEGDSVY